MNGRKRKIQIKFYVTEEERALIKQKMKLVPTRNMAEMCIRDSSKVIRISVINAYSAPSHTFSFSASIYASYIRTVSPDSFATGRPTKYQSSPISILTGTQVLFTFTSKHSPQCNPP